MGEEEWASIPWVLDCDLTSSPEDIVLLSTWGETVGWVSGLGGYDVVKSTAGLIPKKIAQWGSAGPSFLRSDRVTGPRPATRLRACG